MSGDRPPDYSVIVPARNEEKIARELYQRVARQLDSLGVTWEIVFVDDGSTDDTLAVLSSLSQDARVRLVALSRNFGSHVAIGAGLDFACGQTVIVLAGDLQDRPEDIPALVEKLKQGFDVCYAVDAARDESLSKRLPSALFYCVASLLGAEFSVRRVFFAANRRAADALKGCRERYRYIPEQMDWIGFKRTSVEVPRDKRFAGQSNYNFRRLVELAMTAISAKSEIVLRIPFVFFVISMLSAVLLLCLGESELNMSRQLVFLSVLIIALAGLQFLFVSVLGEYVNRIFRESRRRPLYVVRSTIPADLTEFDRCPSKKSER